MPGKPGSGGPVPKRTTQRRRANKPPIPVVSVPTVSAVRVPAADESWHPLAAAWYGSLAESGQRQFFEPSDWAQARVWADLLSRTLLSSKGPSSMMVAAWASGAAELLTTEGARRRLRIELEREKPTDPDAEHADATVTDLMSRLGG